MRKRRNKKYIIYKIYAFSAVVLFFALISLIIPLRPKTSDIEKRTLTRFPKPSLETLWNGEFFEGVNTWYADTFPFRDLLISGNMEMRTAYGIQKNQLYGSMKTAGKDTGETEKKTAEKEKSGKSTEENDRTVEEGKKKREVTQVQEQFGAVYIADNTAFNLYGFNQEAVDQYISAVNALASKVAGDVKVYDMIVPISSGIYLDQKLQKDLGSSDQKDAIQYIHDRLDKKVKPVDVFATLENHNDEYIYFRTDHHWTQLGAYYAYCEFMKEKERKAPPVTEYQTMEFPDFLGTMYAYCNQSPALGNNPDTLTAYVPRSTNDMKYTDVNGTVTDYKIITDVSEWDTSAKYNCYIAGDQPYAEIHNPVKTDGSACLLIKESYGNAFAPFLVDDYEYVYVVDYRYYPSGLATLIQEKNIKDVLFLNNVSAASNDSLVPLMAEIMY